MGTAALLLCWSWNKCPCYSVGHPLYNCWQSFMLLYIYYIWCFLFSCYVDTWPWMHNPYSRLFYLIVLHGPMVEEMPPRVWSHCHQRSNIPDADSPRKATSSWEATPGGVAYQSIGLGPSHGSNMGCIWVLWRLHVTRRTRWSVGLSMNPDSCALSRYDSDNWTVAGS